MGHFKNLIVYNKSYELAMEIFGMTKSFPKLEEFLLCNQIRRSSRSVCANLAEAYSRRSSVKYFISKLFDCLAENSETEVWLDFSFSCCYIPDEQYQSLSKKNAEVRRMISHMINNPEKFL